MKTTLFITSSWTALRCASLHGARSCLLGSLRPQPNNRSLCSLIMKLVTPGHIWSQLVTNCCLVTGCHIGHTLYHRNPMSKDITAVTERQTDARRLLYRFLLSLIFFSSEELNQSLKLPRSHRILAQTSHMYLRLRLFTSRSFLWETGISYEVQRVE